jgi:hypothetical protein
MLLEVRHEAEVRKMERVLRTYGCLTKERLLEFSGADRWPTLDAFHRALEEAVAAGRIKKLGTDLYHLPDDADTNSPRGYVP